MCNSGTKRSPLPVFQFPYFHWIWVTHTEAFAELFLWIAWLPVKNTHTEVYFCIFMIYCRSLLLIYSLVIHFFFIRHWTSAVTGRGARTRSFNQIDDELVSKLECHRCVRVCVLNCERQWHHTHTHSQKQKKLSPSWWNLSVGRTKIPRLPLWHSKEAEVKTR